LKELSNSNIKLSSRQEKQLRPDTTDQDLSNSFAGGHLDKSLRVESEKIQNLESEISQALEKLDSFESRESKKTESVSKKSNSIKKGIDEFVENDSESPNSSNVTSKKDSLRNLTS
jgi:hypothetical protein